MSQRETVDRDTRRVATNAANGQGDAANPAISRRAVAAALLFAVLALVAGMVLVQAFVVKRIPGLTAARLEMAEELWGRKGPASYDLDLEIRGAQPGNVHVEVRNREVTAAARDGRIPSQHTWDTWSVPGQFETLERELELAEDPEHEMDVAEGTQLRLRCEFDSQFGFPRQYHRHVSGGGPEVYWRVTKFTPK